MIRIPKDKLLFFVCLLFADLSLAYCWPSDWYENFFASIAIFVVARPSRRSIGVWVVLFLVACLVHPSWALVGTSAFLALLYRAALENRRQDFLIALGFAVFVLLVWWGNAFALHWHAGTIDSRMAILDKQFGFNPNGAVAWLFKLRPLRLVAGYAYLGLSAGLAAIYVLNRDDGRWTIEMLIAGIVGFAVYQIAPAVGPARVGTVNPPINCVPSLHFGWCLLALWNARTRSAKTVAWFLICLIGLATLGFGEHYLIDLIVAVPFCAAIHRRAVVPAIVVSAWLVLIRSAYIPAHLLLYVFALSSLLFSMSWAQLREVGRIHKSRYASADLTRV